MIREILCGDSAFILQTMPSNFVDIIITSPPYNVAHKYENYDDDLEFSEYLKAMKSIFTQCFRVLKSGGRLCVNVPFAVKNKENKSVRFLSVYIMQILNEIGFVEFELISWHKGKDIKHFQGNNTAWGSWKSPSCPSFRPLGEAVLVFYKDKREHRGEAKNIDITGDEFKSWTKNLWYFDKDKNQIFENLLCASNNAKKDAHPAPYPEELIEKLLKIYSYEKDIVLDPFNGTGTTSVVACKLNRAFIGIELSKKYCQIALQRLNGLNLAHFFHIKSYDKRAQSLVNSDEVACSLNEVFPYKEAFSPFLLDFLKDRFSLKFESVFDPFCGVGSSFLNENAKICYGFDTNPFALNVAKAKLEFLGTKAINEAAKIAANFNKNLITNHALPKWNSFYKYADIKRFSVIMSFIKSFSKLKSQHFVKYLVLSNLDKMLDFKMDGNGIKFRKSKVENSLEFLKNLTQKGLNLKAEFDAKNDKKLKILNASSLENTLKIKVDLVLTSPPYANLFDYFEVYKMQLWSAEIKSYEEWKELKKSALRNNKNANLKQNESINNALLNATLKELKSKNLEKATQTMLKNYFYDMKIVLEKCFEMLKNGGFCFVVVGNSCYKGVCVKSDEILAQEAVKMGFECVEILIARKLKTSSQQMRILDEITRLNLRESIVVLRKAKNENA